ncbi:MAG: thioesterase family protein [Verrucomicrobiota bacterium]
MSAELPLKPQITVPIEVFFFDTDAGGVVHNVAYLRMVEVARSKLAESLNWSLKEMQDEGKGCPVVVRTEIDYLIPAKLGDVLEIHAEITEMQRIRFYIRFTIRRKSDNVVISKVNQVMATLNLTTGRPLALREDWVEQWPDLCPR